MKPAYYVSTVSGKKYPYGKWVNFGENPGGEVIRHKVSYMDLPLEDYPYTLEYEEERISKWKEKNTK